MVARWTAFRRWLIIALVIVPLLWIDWKLYKVLSSGGINTIDIAVLVLFSFCIVHLIFSFVLACCGFLVSIFRLNPVTLLREPTSKLLPSEPPSGNHSIVGHRVAIALPVYKEDLKDVVERVATLYGDLEASGDLSQVDFFFLSDSPIENEEEEVKIWEEAKLVLKAEGKLFYRRRLKNSKKKSGNVHDFLEHHRSGYRYFCVLDADSTMTGASVLAMHEVMERDPKIAAVQTVPFSIRGESLFSKLLEWNSKTYSRLFGMGFAFWQGHEANYYGHNALIRTVPFWDHCTLPELPGKPPFGGTILSHDFVESALLVKNGFRVLMLPQIAGSYEEIPNSLVDFLIRDRRWMMGNMQHLRVAYFLSLTPFSRFQLIYGAYCYLASILWFLFLAAATVQTIFYHENHLYFSTPHQLFPDWPVSQTLVTLAIYLLTLGLIVVPKLLGLFERALCSGQSWSIKGSFLQMVSFFTEFLCTALLAPIVMMFHLRFFCGFIRGKSVAWDPQQRGITKKPFSVYWNDYGWLSLVGAAWMGLIWWYESPLVWWIIPVLVPLVFAPVLTWLMERAVAFEKIKISGIFAAESFPRRALNWND
jgi:membrane glycosyltransferase